MSRKLRYALTVGLSLALVGWVVYKVRHNPEWRNFDFSQFQAMLLRLDYRFLLVALFAIYSTYLLRSLRWREFLMPIKMTSITNLFTATVIGFGGLALLGRPGELVRPYLISRKEAMPVTTQMAVWVLERVYDLSMIIVIVGGVMFFSLDAEDLSPGKTRALHYLRTAGLSALVMTLFGIGALGLFRRYWNTLVPWMMGRLQFLPGPLVKGLRAICEDFGQGLSSLRSSRAFLMGLLYTTLVCHRGIAAAGAGHRRRHPGVHHHRPHRSVRRAPGSGRQRGLGPVAADLRGRGAAGPDFAVPRTALVAQAPPARRLRIEVPGFKFQVPGLEGWHPDASPNLKLDTRHFKLRKR
jgi:hypothetical protein